MANKIYVGEEGAKELYRKVKELIPTLSSAIDSDSETTAATSKAVKDAYDALDTKISARAIFFGSVADWDAYKQEHPEGDSSKVYYVLTGSGEDKYTVYVWKDVPGGISFYEEVDESSISLEGYWHDAPTFVAGQGTTDTFVTGVTLANDGTVSFTTKAVQDVAASTGGAGGNHGLMGATDKEKLDGIEAGAQVNVKPDWDAASGDAAEILNKPELDSTMVSNTSGGTTYWGVKNPLPDPIGNNTMLFSENGNTDLRWANWSSVTVSKKTENSVLIGKTWYPYVKIGNYYWTTENLREPIGTENTNYRLYDPNTLVERGYLYKYDTILKKTWHDNEYANLEASDAMLALLHDGWHIPTINELNTLKSLGGEYDGGAKFFATNAFDIGGVTYTRLPTDNYGFKGYPCGSFSQDDNKTYGAHHELFIMSTTVGYAQQQRAWFLDLQPGSYTNLLSTCNANAWLSVRLCKSAT